MELLIISLYTNCVDCGATNHFPSILTVVDCGVTNHFPSILTVVDCGGINHFPSILTVLIVELLIIFPLY